MTAGPWVSVHRAIFLGKEWIIQPLRTLYGLRLVLTLNKMIKSLVWHNYSTLYAQRSLALKPDVTLELAPHIQLQDQ